MTPLPGVLIVGSLNASKLAAVREAAATVLPGWSVQAAAVDSGVTAQPWGDREVWRGARARAIRAAAGAGIRAWGLGLESGLAVRARGVFGVGWCVCSDGRRVLGAATTPAWRLPGDLAAEARAGRAAGLTLAQVTARRFGGTAEGWSRSGTVAALTGGRVDRAALWAVPLLLVLSEAVGSSEGPDSAPRRASGPALAGVQAARQGEQLAGPGAERTPQ